MGVFCAAKFRDEKRVAGPVPPRGLYLGNVHQGGLAAVQGGGCQYPVLPIRKWSDSQGRRSERSRFGYDADMLMGHQVD